MSTVPPSPPSDGGSTPVPYAYIGECTATPSSVEVAYGEYVPVHVSFTLPRAAGSYVALRYVQPGGIGYNWVPIDSTGRGADFMVGLPEPAWELNGQQESYGTPHTQDIVFGLGEPYNSCSVRITPR